jgi:hypothetical protein
MAAIAPQLKTNKFHGEWNYTVTPGTATAKPATAK